MCDAANGVSWCVEVVFSVGVYWKAALCLQSVRGAATPSEKKKTTKVRGFGRHNHSPSGKLKSFAANKKEKKRKCSRISSLSSLRRHIHVYIVHASVILARATMPLKPICVLPSPVPPPPRHRQNRAGEHTRKRLHKTNVLC